MVGSGSAAAGFCGVGCSGAGYGGGNASGAPAGNGNFGSIGAGAVEAGSGVSIPGFTSGFLASSPSPDLGELFLGSDSVLISESQQGSSLGRERSNQ